MPLKFGSQVGFFPKAVAALVSPCLLASPATLAAQTLLKTEPEPGEIVISRDVNSRGIGSPNSPGAVSAVDAGAEDVILGALSSGLKPLSDSEVAAVNAGEGAQRPPLPGSIAGLDLSGPELTAGADLGVGSQGGGGGVVGQAVGQGISALQSTLGTIGQAVGGSE